jgi:hypothetical protein
LTRRPKAAGKTPLYRRYFDFLETDKELTSGIKDEMKMRGLPSRRESCHRYQPKPQSPYQLLRSAQQMTVARHRGSRIPAASADIRR